MSPLRLGAATHPPAAPPRPLRVLLVEVGSDHVARLEASLDEAAAGEVELRGHATLADAGSALRSGEFDCVLLDLSRPYANGLESLAKVRMLAPEASPRRPTCSSSGPRPRACGWRPLDARQAQLAEAAGVPTTPP